jgi:hypothetical protein
MTPAHRIEAIYSEDGKLLVDHLPVRAGQTVEVIVLPVHRVTPSGHILRGTVFRYDQPTAPVAETAWGCAGRRQSLKTEPDPFVCLV